MKDKDFSATFWLANNQQNKSIANQEKDLLALEMQAPLPSFKSPTIADHQEENHFVPHKHFIQGWVGESLLSKSLVTLIRDIGHITKDVKNQFLKGNFNPSLKDTIYNDFINYCNKKAIYLKINNFSQLLTALKEGPAEAGENHLGEYLELFTNRVAIIYLLKIRFIKKLSIHQQIDVSNSQLLNINHFINKIFQRGSSLELNTKAFNSNIYSWYLPQSSLSRDIRKIFESCCDLSLTELSKISSHLNFIDPDDNHFSHSLSHINYGLFVNSLIINMPIWLNKQIHQEQSGKIKSALAHMEIISTKYIGYYLGSISNSHWLAQDSNKNIKWEQIICPKFEPINKTHNENLFFRLWNELQFLSMLPEIAISQNKNPMTFMAHTLKGNLLNKKNQLDSFEPNFLFATPVIKTSTYDRIVLTLIDKELSPYKIIAQVLDQFESLKKHGRLLMFTDKNIFTSSLKDKNQQLLKKFKLEALLDLSLIEGRGEVPKFIYIFQKLSPNSSGQVSNPRFVEFFHFKFNGILQTFQSFSVLTEQLYHFLIGHLNETPPIAIREDQQSKFEMSFFRDSLSSDFVISSHQHNNGLILHPAFFKNIISQTVPLGSIAIIQKLPQENLSNQRDILDSIRHQDTGYVLAISTSQELLNLQIFPFAKLLTLLEKEEHTFNYFFYLTAIDEQVDLSLLNLYFHTVIGSKITEFCIGDTRKVSINLIKSLLIPKIYQEKKSYLSKIQSEIYEETCKAVTCFGINDTDANKKLNQYFLNSHNLKKNSPLNFLKEVYSLRHLLNQHQINLTEETSIFYNPVFQAQLCQLPLKPLLNNDDLYVSGHPLNLLSSNLKIAALSVDSEYDTARLSIKLDNGFEIYLNSDHNMINFCYALFHNMLEQPLAPIMSAVQLPDLRSLNDLIGKFNLYQRGLKQMREQFSQELNQVFQKFLQEN